MSGKREQFLFRKADFVYNEKRYCSTEENSCCPQRKSARRLIFIRIVKLIDYEENEAKDTEKYSHRNLYSSSASADYTADPRHWPAHGRTCRYIRGNCVYRECGIGRYCSNRRKNQPAGRTGRYIGTGPKSERKVFAGSCTGGFCCFWLFRV